MPLKIHGIPLHQFPSGKIQHLSLFTDKNKKKMVPLTSDKVLEY
jgi:hypothetical protein